MVTMTVMMMMMMMVMMMMMMMMVILTMTMTTMTTHKDVSTSELRLTGALGQPSHSYAGKRRCGVVEFRTERVEVLLAHRSFERRIASTKDIARSSIVFVRTSSIF